MTKIAEDGASNYGWQAMKIHSKETSELANLIVDFIKTQLCSYT